MAVTTVIALGAFLLEANHVVQLCIEGKNFISQIAGRSIPGQDLYSGRFTPSQGLYYRLPPPLPLSILSPASPSPENEGMVRRRVSVLSTPLLEEGLSEKQQRKPKTMTKLQEQERKDLALSRAAVLSMNRSLGSAPAVSPVASPALPAKRQRKLDPMAKMQEEVLEEVLSASPERKEAAIRRLEVIARHITGSLAAAPGKKEEAKPAAAAAAATEEEAKPKEVKEALDKKEEAKPAEAPEAPVEEGAVAPVAEAVAIPAVAEAEKDPIIKFYARCLGLLGVIGFLINYTETGKAVSTKICALIESCRNHPLRLLAFLMTVLLIIIRVGSVRDLVNFFMFSFSIMWKLIALMIA